MNEVHLYRTRWIGMEMDFNREWGLWISAINVSTLWKKGLGLFRSN